MLCRYDRLRSHPALFLSLTGLRLAEFEDLLTDVLPRCAAQAQAQRQRPDRRRAPGAGRRADVCWTNQILMTVIWLRQYPTNELLGYLFGVSDSTASRVLARILPLLEAAGRDTMRMPDPGKKHRKTHDQLLAEPPALAVLIDTFEQRVQRPKTQQEAYYSGKKRQHTLKVQVTIDETTGTICDIADSVPGPTADITLVKESGVLTRLPEDVGALGDLAYQGIADAHPQGLGATPRRKPRGKDRPPEDCAFNRAFARRRIRVEHTIGRMRRYQCLSQQDRHHRQNHSARTRAVAGLANRQLRSRLPC